MPIHAHSLFSACCKAPIGTYNSYYFENITFPHGRMCTEQSKFHTQVRWITKLHIQYIAKCMWTPDSYVVIPQAAATKLEAHNYIGRVCML